MMPAKNNTKRFLIWVIFLLLFLVIIFLTLFFIKKQSHISEYENNINARLKYLESVQQKNVKENEFSQLKNKFIALENNFSEQLLTISSLNKEVQTIVSQLQGENIRLKALENLLPVLKENQQQYETQLDILRSQITTISEMKKQEKPVVKPAQTKVVQSAPQKVPQSKASFAFIGTEYRGGEIFAAVLPKNALSLSQIELIGVGGGIHGWTLSKVSNNNAQFTAKGRTLTLRAE
ncbi:hypothetical protein [Xenorhabdus koppenhoeferi]|uniref:Uncharacterized protein n=1 Tax=Xenorhabdus koppenhoeferi TaxID=351659 RepID=A0A1I7H5R4_9GAMM|nr:hypothetical protein [Xenorhabdus koppenhoeferi]CEE94263.1 hypothetical protein XNA1_4550018 [Xenorhabdus nematophila str. Anatoliense]SFU56009.1 hypothetical protein SAMN05421784_11179 [Xenorhabdus koppenhoeferi]